MSTLEDLPHKSILDMTQDEALEHMRQLRLSRRTPTRKTRKQSPHKPKNKPLPKLNANQAAELLKLLEK